MNLQDGEDPNNSIFVSFNQDCSNICVGTKTGYKIIKFTPEGNLEKVIEDTSDEARIVEQMYTSTLVAHVSQTSPRKLRVILHKSNSEVAQQSYSDTILAVKLNKKYYVVCLEDCIYIHEMTDCHKIHTIREVPRNPNGICALAPDPESSLLAYPGNCSTGEVAIFDCKLKQNKLVIPAHDNPLAAVAFNYAGTKIATASERGTVIRVFNVSDGQSQYEFRRGYARCVSIYSLSFSYDSLFLCASSNTETVHIFKLEDPKENKSQEEPQGWMGWMGKALIQSVHYLPAQVSEMLNQWRSFAIARLPFSGLKNVCGISMTGKVPRVIVASADGYLYIYDLNVNEPGECVLSKQYRLQDDCLEGPHRMAKLPGSLSYAAAVRGTEGNGSQASATSPLTSGASADTSTPQRSQQTATRSDATNAINYDGDFPPMTTYKNSF